MKITSLYLAALVASAAIYAPAQDWSHDKDKDWKLDGVKHVLLISVDGMHAVDFANCARGVAGVNGGDSYCPNMKALASTGVHYTAANTSKPSDSFPGLMSIVSGATPRLLGVYYDVAYDRSLDAPTITTGNGVAGGPCVAGAAPTGTTTEYEEGIDLDQTKLNGGAPGASLTDGTAAAIDAKRLPRDPARGCKPVYPWEFVRTNTIFGVIHDKGGYAAWSDKHPAYSSVAGRSGIGVLDDFYSPEINSNVVPLPGIRTPTGIDCSTVPDPGSDVSAWTNSFLNIQCYDELKVKTVLGWIEGKTHNGGKGKVPTIFGMNFQALSVGQKLNEKSNGMRGGYLDSAATPSEALLLEFKFVDDSIGRMVAYLKANGHYESTLIIITAKHGQNPIDPNFYDPILNTGTSPATLLDNAGLIPFSEAPSNPTGIGSTEDDISLLWLKSPADTETAVGILEQNIKQAGIGQIFHGRSLSINYDVPGLAPNDPRTPDIIVTPNVGVVYTGSSKKQEEHGGFAHDDTNVILLVSNPGLVPQTVYSEVGTNQIAPTILETLGIDPKLLDGVRLEGTQALPR